MKLLQKRLSMGKTKASYVNYRFIPNFHEILLKEIKLCFDYIVCFDESLTKVIQRGQYGLVLRFWSVKFQRVSTEYWFSTLFLGRESAEHIK